MTNKKDPTKTTEGDVPDLIRAQHLSHSVLSQHSLLLLRATQFRVRELKGTLRTRAKIKIKSKTSQLVHVHNSRLLFLRHRFEKSLPSSSVVTLVHLLAQPL